MISDVSLRSEEIDGSRTVARVDLLGEIERTAAGVARFRRGVREYAAIGDPARMIGSAELNLIYASTSARAITIGHLSQDPSIPAYVDTDHMLAKHFAVVGSTGVGKSSAVASILGKMIEVRPELRVLLLDVHNEYRAAFGDRANVIGAENLRLPFWLFNFEETLNVLYGGKPAAPEEAEILAELIPVAKAKYQAGPERVSVERRQAAAPRGLHRRHALALPPPGPPRPHPRAHGQAREPLVGHEPPPADDPDRRRSRTTPATSSCSARRASAATPWPRC